MQSKLNPGVLVTITAITFGLSLLSCNSNNTEGLPSYVNCSKPKHLKGTRILPDTFMGHPGSFICSGDTMLISDSDNEYFYSAISISNDSLIARCGRRGHGPGELLGHGLLHRSDNGSISFFEDPRSRLYSYTSISDFVNKPDSANFIEIDGNMIGHLSTTKNGFVGDLLAGDGHIMAIYDSKGKMTGVFGQVPNTSIDSLTQPDFYLAYQVEKSVSPDGKKLCVSGVYHDWIAFYDMSSKEPILIKEYYSTPPKVKTENSSNFSHVNLLPTTTTYFSGASATNDNVYLLYHGATEAEKEIGEIDCRILKYDWNGELQECYQTDEPLDFIYVATDGKTIYAKTAEYVDPDPRFFKYNLNE